MNNPKRMVVGEDGLSSPIAGAPKKYVKSYQPETKKIMRLPKPKTLKTLKTLQTLQTLKILNPKSLRFSQWPSKWLNVRGEAGPIEAPQSGAQPQDTDETIPA